MKKICFIVMICVAFIQANAQHIVFTLVNDSVKTGFPGDEIALLGIISNTDTAATDVFVERVEENIPVDWQTYFCTDVCLLPTTSTNTVNVAGQYDQDFSIHFTTSATPDSGNVLMTFTNLSNPSNSMQQRFFAMTDSTYSSVSTRHPIQEAATLFPNPLIGNRWITLRLPERFLSHQVSLTLIIRDMTGKVVSRTPRISHAVSVIELNRLQAGAYTYALYSPDQAYTQRGVLIIR